MRKLAHGVIYLFHKNKSILVYISLASGVFIGCVAFRKLGIAYPIMFLLSAILLLSGRNWWMLLAFGISTLYQILFAFLFYGFLPTQGMLTFLNLVFFVWIFSAGNQEPWMESTSISFCNYQKCIILYVCFMFLGTCHLMFADLRYPFSGTSECGKFLRDKIKLNEKIAIYPRDDRLTGISAYLKHDVLDFEHNRSISFSPRNTRGDRSMPKRLEADVLVVRIPGKQPSQIIISNKTYRPIWTTPPCIVPDEFATVFVNEHRPDLYPSLINAKTAKH